MSRAKRFLRAEAALHGLPLPVFAGLFGLVCGCFAALVFLLILAVGGSVW